MSVSGRMDERFGRGAEITQNKSLLSVTKDIHQGFWNLMLICLRL